ncbi:MAG: alpha/beta hydrolase [Oceanospirillaceae bacterium]|uniref:alpha/beta fold hydrolase n=1 Tax=unclassified Thalassolituus TaxID=2624967 RepID=UPI000C0AE6E3|nr:MULTISPECIES: alpha/beta hydrolase [unclassified Thalassolituus]MAK90868.1 alpha/beta hydrolase [Thalassolituus sp.]MAS25989.1 alpha/beta hydrolase [Oceanospirillaceae bacterium]MAX99932.1 alpha/beta hydrolase [Oceanospirillaceae bacterium]MBL35332.1 alpha/beta hydrolase [Oceanospirillaceae bacterium]MBS51964.1 alpha/beta hydrolase [Oceanospirillaceae bacterium]|tara:strand:- start:2055 stop:2930 length:876 start_codon:yes stop_codon:yes gene_type:complete
MTVMQSRHELMITTPEGPRRMAYQLWQSSERSDQPLIICVHGLTRNSHDFDALAEVLAKQARVVCPDVLGRGDSEWLLTPALYGYPLYISQMQQFLAQLNIDYGNPPLYWVGTSMGGLIGMMLAAMPGACGIEKLIMNDVGPFVPYAALERLGDYVGKAPLFTDVAAAEQWLRRIAAPFGPLTDEQWQHLARYGTEPDPDNSGQLRVRYDPAIAEGFALVTGDVDLSMVWQAVVCPVLVIRGGDSDLLLPETARSMLQREDTRLVEFPGIGHAPMLMARDQIKAVQEFLNG